MTEILAKSDMPIDRCRINHLNSESTRHRWFSSLIGIIEKSACETSAYSASWRFAIAERDAPAMEIPRILHIIALHALPTYSLTWGMARIENTPLYWLSNLGESSERLLLLTLASILRYVLCVSYCIVSYL